MNRLLSILLTLICAAPECFLFASSGEYQSLSIYFDKDKDHLTESAIEVLETIPEGSVVRLVGHTDSDGSDNYNVDLSLRRVSSAKKYLVGNGFPEHMVQKDYCGEFDPINENKGEPEMRWNRRVEILYRCPLAHEWVPAQTHKFLNGAGTEIYGEQGSIVIIPPNAFDVPENAIVQFNLREFYALEDIIKVGLNTNSDRGMLETAGMMHLEAFAGGEELELQKPIDLGFTGIVEARTEDGYQLFNMTYDEGMDPVWVAQSSFTEEVASKELSTNSNDWTTAAAVDVPESTENNEAEDWDYERGVFSGSKPEGSKVYVTEIYGQGMTFDQMFFWQNEFEDIISDQPACFTGIKINGVLTQGGVFLPKSTSWGDGSPVCNDVVLEGLSGLSALGPDIRPTEDIDVCLFFNPALKAEYQKDYRAYLHENTMEILSGEDTANLLSANESSAIVSDYLFSSTELGFINCDRFYNSENNDVNIMVDAEKTDRSFLVFKGIKSVMASQWVNDACTISGIPNGEEATLVTIRNTDGKFELAIQDLTTEPGTLKPEGFIALDEESIYNAIGALSF
jgi:hypothetical protein